MWTAPHSNAWPPARLWPTVRKAVNTFAQQLPTTAQFPGLQTMHQNMCFVSSLPSFGHSRSVEGQGIWHLALGEQSQKASGQTHLAEVQLLLLELLLVLLQELLVLLLNHQVLQGLCVLRQGC